MKRLHKKAVAEFFVVGAILTLMALFISIFAFIQFTEKAVLDDKASERLCQASIAARMRTATKIQLAGGAITPELRLPSQCQTIDIRLEEKEKKEAMRKIADKMSRCWWQFGEGRYEQVLGATEIFKTSLFGSGDKVKNGCFLCYTLDLPKLEEQGIYAEDLADFLRKEKHPVVDLTYLQYIQRHGGPGSVTLLAPEMKKGTTYAISFLSKNKDGTTPTMDKVIAGYTGGVASGAGAVVLCSAFTGGACTAGLAVFSLVGYSSVVGANKNLEEIRSTVAQNVYQKTNRHTSVIIVDELTSAQKYCFKGDLKGK